MIRVRRASTGDATAIAQVHVDTWRSIYVGLVPDRVLVNMSYQTTAASWSLVLRGRGMGERVHVAEVRPAPVVGFASAGLARSLATTSGGGSTGEVFTLYVLDDFQGRGLGRDLLLASFRYLLEREFESAVIWVLARNPSRFFYEAMGGAPVAEREENLWGVCLPEVAYGWPDLKRALIAARQ